VAFTSTAAPYLCLAKSALPSAFRCSAIACCGIFRSSTIAPVSSIFRAAVEAEGEALRLPALVYRSRRARSIASKPDVHRCPGGRARGGRVDGGRVVLIGWRGRRRGQRGEC
jgi:hypothetical protein